MAAVAVPRTISPAQDTISPAQEPERGDVVSEEAEPEDPEPEDPEPEDDEDRLNWKHEQGIGKSRAGWTTKFHVLCDQWGRPVCIVVTGGHCTDQRVLEQVLREVRLRHGRGHPAQRPGLLIADKGYSCKASRQLLRRRGIRMMIPEKRDQRSNRKAKGRRGGRPCRYDRALYRLRNVVERCIRRLKDWRRIATRYDKTQASYQAFLTLASIMLWLNS
jgi:transposase